MKEPDPSLLKRCQQGDAEAFAELVAEQQNYVFTLALRVLHDREEAADLSQEVFLHVWKGLPFFRGESRFRTWLYKIVVNHSLNRLRRLKREQGIVWLEEVEADRLPGQERDPHAEAWQQERRTLIWKEVERLPVRYRLVLSLFYQQEMSCAEIAEATGMPVGTVKTHLHRARLALANTLGKRGDDAL